MGTGLSKSMSVLKLYPVHGPTLTRFLQIAYTWKNESSVFIGTKNGTGWLSWNAATINMSATTRRGPIALGS